MTLNVLHLVDSFNTGGSECQAVQLVRILDENGRFKVHVACLSREGPLEEIARRHSSCGIVEFPLTSFYDRNMAVQTRRFVKLLRERRIDVVHSHDFYTNIFGMLGARLAGTPVRIASRRETTGTRTAAHKKIERFAYGLSHAIIANAEAVRSQLLSEGIRSRKIETIYNGVATPNVKRPAEGENGAIRARFGLPRD